MESQNDHESVAKELLTKGFLFGTREDASDDTEAVLAGNVVSVAIIAGSQLFTLPEFHFEPPAQKSAPVKPPKATAPAKASAASKKAAAKPQKAAKKKPKR